MTSLGFLCIKLSLLLPVVTAAEEPAYRQNESEAEEENPRDHQAVAQSVVQGLTFRGITKTDALGVLARIEMAQIVHSNGGLPAVIIPVHLESAALWVS